MQIFENLFTQFVKLKFNLKPGFVKVLQNVAKLIKNVA